MQRIRALDVTNAPAGSLPLLKAVQNTLGTVPNLFGTLAHSPAALQAYLQQSQALSAGSLSAQLREQIALATAGENGCDYCASAHAMLGKRAGLNRDEVGVNLRGEATDARVRTALAFARAIIERRGHVDDAHLQAMRDAGYSDAEVVEIVAVVAMNIFTNYFNHVARTVVDFPLVKAVG